MTSVCSWPAPLACLVIRKPLRFWPRARNQAKTRQGPSFAEQKFFAPCLKSQVLSECGGAKEGEGGRPDMEVCAMSSGWLDGLPAVSANSSRRRLDERGSQIDCLHDEVLVSSTTEKESGNSRVGKAALRACGSMPTRQHNQRRSTLLHRLAREHRGTWHHSSSKRDDIDRAVPAEANGLGLPAALSCERPFP